jgi:hypothetical protein
MPIPPRCSAGVRSPYTFAVPGMHKVHDADVSFGLVAAATVQNRQTATSGALRAKFEIAPPTV